MWDRRVRRQVEPTPEAIQRAWRDLYRDRNRRADRLSVTVTQWDEIVRSPDLGGGVLFANPSPEVSLFGMLVERRRPDDLAGVAWIEYEE